MKSVAAAVGLMVQANTCVSAFIAAMRFHGPGIAPVVDCRYIAVLSWSPNIKG